MKSGAGAHLRPRRRAARRWTPLGISEVGEMHDAHTALACLAAEGRRNSRGAEKPWEKPGSLAMGNLGKSRKINKHGNTMGISWGYSKVGILKQHTWSHDRKWGDHGGIDWGYKVGKILGVKQHIFLGVWRYENGIDLDRSGLVPLWTNHYANYCPLWFMVGISNQLMGFTNQLMTRRPHVVSAKTWGVMEETRRIWYEEIQAE
jgi:hypothetical protein